MTSSKSNYFTKAPPPNTNTLEIKVQLMDFGSGVLEKTFESPKDSKEIKSVNPKGNQLWIFIGSTDAEAEAPVLRPLDKKSRLIGKDPDAEKDWWQEEKRGRQRMRWLDGITNSMNMSLSNDSEGQGSLVCWSSWSHRVRHNLVAEQYVAHMYEMHSASLWICLWGEFVLMQ